MAEARVTPTKIGDLTLTITRQGDGPAVVLLHGFPEIAYSWRHQIPALVDAGYRVIAPDQRGYGWSDAPESREAYAMTELVGDVIAILDHDGITDAVIVGHDWGALVAPWVALFRPDRVRGLALLSVPYTPRSERSPVEHIRATDPDGDFAYVLAFQEDGAEAEFEANPMESLRRMYWSVSGDRPDEWKKGDPVPRGLPSHLSAGEFENYVRAFARSGFTGPINYYRNLHQNWVFTRPWHHATLDLPVLFIAGSKDFVATTADGGLGSTVEAMNTWCTDLRGIHLIEGAGHWVQQEAPDQINQLLIAFLESLNA